MTCEEFRAAVWREIDANRQSLSACPAGHADCRKYAERARRLHRMLPDALGEAPRTSVVGSVLEKISAARERTSPTTSLIPAGTLAVLAACYGIVYYFGWTTVAPYTPVPAPDSFLFLPDVGWAAAAAARLPLSWLAPPLLGAGLLWIFTLTKGLADTAREDGHG